MQIRLLAACAALSLSLLPAARGSDPNFPGVEKAMPAETFKAAGLAKLSPGERAALDEWIRGYSARRSQEAARQAGVDKAKAITESKISGSYVGFNERSIIVLENGDSYRVAQYSSSRNNPIQSPRVFLIPTMLGLKMFIPATGDEFRVVKSN
ncbi:MAG: hypothetical protein JSR82_14340 [Verrucomicrobia bacterium]|nr:hypothetical protein [Verrucomicrobiota bacterium]